MKTKTGGRGVRDPKINGTSTILSTHKRFQKKSNFHEMNGVFRG